MYSDPIAELLTKIRNAQQARHRYVDVPYSKLKTKILEILKKHRFVDDFLIDKENFRMRVFLRYVAQRQALVHGLKRVSRPGCRQYVGYREIPHVFNGLGLAILSTPAGIVDGRTARSLKVGGELLCAVW